MTKILMPAPRTPQDIADAIADARRDDIRLEIRGGGTKASIGHPDRRARILDMTGFSGIVDYDPAELVLTAGAGTPLAEIEALVAAQGQCLAFEPFDAIGRSTIGGVIAAAVAGPQRLSHGAARDHLLGFTAVSGRGETFKAGGKVVKNVTGYDLPKLMAGSWGRLAALTEVTLKVLPRPVACETRVLTSLDARGAVNAMSAAMGSPAEVAAAAHLPDVDGRALTLLRLQGFAASVAARWAMLEEKLAAFGRLVPWPGADDPWMRVREAAPLEHAPILWRVIVPAHRAPDLIAALNPDDWLMDWAGGLVWIASQHPADALRAVAAAHGAHARLVRAPEAMRRIVPAFHPEAPSVAALSRRVREAFDPRGVFETGRFLDVTDAN